MTSPHSKLTCLCCETCVCVTQRVKVLAPPIWWSYVVDGSSRLMRSVMEKSSLLQNCSGKETVKEMILNDHICLLLFQTTAPRCLFQHTFVHSSPPQIACPSRRISCTVLQKHQRKANFSSCASKGYHTLLSVPTIVKSIVKSNPKHFTVK